MATTEPTEPTEPIFGMSSLVLSRKAIIRKIGSVPSVPSVFLALPENTTHEINKEVCNE
jgi:hypothetical protein